MSLLPLHPEATADPSTVAWYVGPTARGPIALAALDGLVEAGVLGSFATGPERVLTTLAPGRTWAQESARVRDAVRAALGTQAAHPLGPDERDRLLRQAALSVIGDVVGPFARSHGGEITLDAVTDGLVTVHLDGACHGCPAAALTLRARLERELRARCPWLRGVEEARDVAPQRRAFTRTRRRSPQAGTDRVGHSGRVGDVRDLRSAGSVRRRDAQTLAGELVVQAERSAPRAVRHWVMRTIADAGVGGAPNQVVELLTAELVSNAVVHGPEAGDVRVEVRIDGPTVRVGVRDAGGGTPTVGHPEPTAPSGRGLALVEALSSDWGIQTHAKGKTVWFEVRTDDE